MMGGVPGAALKDTICHSAWALLPRACLGAQGWQLGVLWEDAPVRRGTGEPHAPSSVHSTLLVLQATSWHSTQQGWPRHCHSPQLSRAGMVSSTAPPHTMVVPWPGQGPSRPATLPPSHTAPHGVLGAVVLLPWLPVHSQPRLPMLQLVGAPAPDTLSRLGISWVPLHVPRLSSLALSLLRACSQNVLLNVWAVRSAPATLFIRPGRGMVRSSLWLPAAF